MENCKGIDVSHYEPNIDWSGVANAGFAFSIAKCTEGTTIKDQSFDSHWQAMADANLLRGAYHFFRPTGNAADQAKFFCDSFELQKHDLPPICDVEDAGTMSVADLSKSVHAWLDTVQSITGRLPMIYTSVSFGNEHLDASFGGHPLWIARYATVADPGIPHGFSSWQLWQFEENGLVPGVPVPVDVSVFHGGDKAAMAQWCLDH